MKNTKTEPQKSLTLDEIGVAMVTDKSSLLHNYLVEYEKFFPKPEAVKKVVELGLQRTSKKWKDSEVPSVRMWMQFFPNAKIWGFDKQDIQFKDDRFEFFEGGQGRMLHHMQFSESIGWDIDFVISDCSHRPTDDLLSLLFFYPRLKEGGIYIVEDTQALVQKEYPENLRTVNYFEQYLIAIGAEYTWIGSDSSGEKSSLIITKPLSKRRIVKKTGKK